MELTFYLEKTRSQGYTLQQSLAELADNSITHNAKNIWTYMYWSDDSGKNSFIMVVDDGNGMDENELINKALAIPKKEHVDQGEKDHSVYGLGLKTGSFNHCKSITVITKKNKLLRKTLSLKDGITDEMPSSINHKFIVKHLDKFTNQKSGTIILWSELDRISNSNKTKSKKNNVKSDQKQRMNIIHSNKSFKNSERQQNFNNENINFARYNTNNTNTSNKNIQQNEDYSLGLMGKNLTLIKILMSTMNSYLILILIKFHII